MLSSQHRCAEEGNCYVLLFDDAGVDGFQSVIIVLFHPHEICVNKESELGREKEFNPLIFMTWTAC